jgi:hypothetical protein
LVYQFFQADLDPTIGSSTVTTGRDLVEANLVHSSNGSALTLGRQKVNLGAQRLLGSLEWANPSRSWLGARLEAKSWGFFWGELESNPVPNSRAQIGFVSSRHLLGETSLIYKHDRMTPARTSISTIDHRYVEDFGLVRLTAEGAFQWGHKGGADHEAWAATFRADFKAQSNVNLYVEANIATGGSGHTFDNLYPTNHLYYGMMDLQGWSNMKGFAVGASWQPTTNLNLDLSYHDFSLYDDTDGWYGAGGGINKIGGTPMIEPTGASGSHIGSELDLVAKLKASDSIQIEGGVAVFLPGRFVKSFIGGSDANGTFGYFQVGFRF